jgi:hypothetical protein
VFGHLTICSVEFRQSRSFTSIFLRCRCGCVCVCVRRVQITSFALPSNQVQATNHSNPSPHTMSTLFLCIVQLYPSFRCILHAFCMRFTLSRRVQMIMYVNAGVCNSDQTNPTQIYASLLCCALFGTSWRAEAHKSTFQCTFKPFRFVLCI